MGRAGCFRESPSQSFFPFPARVLPSRCNTSLFLRSWRPAEKRHQKTQLLPSCFSTCPLPRELGIVIPGAVGTLTDVRPSGFQERQDTNQMEPSSDLQFGSAARAAGAWLPVQVASGFHYRRLSTDLELHGQNCSWRCCSDAEHEPAPPEGWM